MTETESKYAKEAWSRLVDALAAVSQAKHALKQVPGYVKENYTVRHMCKILIDITNRLEKEQQ